MGKNPFKKEVKKVNPNGEEVDSDDEEDEERVDSDDEERVDSDDEGDEGEVDSDGDKDEEGYNNSYGEILHPTKKRGRHPVAQERQDTSAACNGRLKRGDYPQQEAAATAAKGLADALQGEATAAKGLADALQGEATAAIQKACYASNDCAESNLAVRRLQCARETHDAQFIAADKTEQEVYRMATSAREVADAMLARLEVAKQERRQLGEQIHRDQQGVFRNAISAERMVAARKKADKLVANAAAARKVADAMLARLEVAKQERRQLGEQIHRDQQGVFRNAISAERMVAARKKADKLVANAAAARKKADKLVANAAAARLVCVKRIMTNPFIKVHADLTDENLSVLRKWLSECEEDDERFEEECRKVARWFKQLKRGMSSVGAREIASLLDSTLQTPGEKRSWQDLLAWPDSSSF